MMRNVAASLCSTVTHYSRRSRVMIKCLVVFYVGAFFGLLVAGLMAAVSDE